MSSSAALTLVLIAFLLCGVAAKIAGAKGRDELDFFLLSLVASPVVGILAAVLAKPKEGVVEKRRLDSGAARKCPFCAELIRREAVVCRYCGRELVQEAPAAAPRGAHFRTRAEYERWIAGLAAKKRPSA